AGDSTDLDMLRPAEPAVSAAAPADYGLKITEASGTMPPPFARPSGSFRHADSPRRPGAFFLSYPEVARSPHRPGARRQRPVRRVCSFRRSGAGSGRRRARRAGPVAALRAADGDGL